MNVGDKAPEILGINEKGEEIRLSNYKGKKIVLTFIQKTQLQAVRRKPATCATTMPTCARPVMKLSESA